MLRTLSRLVKAPVTRTSVSRPPLEMAPPGTSRPPAFNEFTTSSSVILFCASRAVSTRTCTSRFSPPRICAAAIPGIRSIRVRIFASASVRKSRTERVGQVKPISRIGRAFMSNFCTRGVFVSVGRLALTRSICPRTSPIATSRFVPTLNSTERAAKLLCEVEVMSRTPLTVPIASSNGLVSCASTSGGLAPG